MTFYRGPRSRGSKVTSLAGSATHMASTHVSRLNSRTAKTKSGMWNTKFRPTGPALAEQTYDINDWEDELCSDSSDYDDDVNVQAEDYLYDQYQYTLDLESPLELQQRMQQQIRKYERAYERMCMDALRWHQLMDDVENNPQIEKAFAQMQLLRKLSGSEFE
jgi:hypothetical protein